MNYLHWRTKYEESRPVVLEIVQNTEAALAGASPGKDASELRQRFSSWLPFSDRIWTIYLANTSCLQGVNRIGGAPYATHPTRMALSCYWLLTGDNAEHSAAAALLHDYLEESGGISRHNVAAMQRAFANEPMATPAAVLLSEPDIPYENLGSEDERTRWHRIAYVIQVQDALAAGAPRSFANAALADKLDNLHDFGYLERDKNEERRARKIAQRLAYFRLVAIHIGPSASPELLTVLTEGLTSKSAQYGTSKLEQTELGWLNHRLDAAQDTIRTMISSFHKEIGTPDFPFVRIAPPSN